MIRQLSELDLIDFHLTVYDQLRLFLVLDDERHCCHNGHIYLLTPCEGARRLNPNLNAKEGGTIVTLVEWHLKMITAMQGLYHKLSADTKREDYAKQWKCLEDCKTDAFRMGYGDDVARYLRSAASANPLRLKKETKGRTFKGRWARGALGWRHA